MFGAFGPSMCRAEYCVTLEATFGDIDITYEKWDMENRREARFGATLASSSLKDNFRGLSPEIYSDISRGNKTVVGGSS